MDNDARIQGQPAATEAEMAGRLTKAAREATAATRPAVFALAMRAAAAFPDSLNVQHRAGVALLACGEVSAALERFERALVIRPRFHFTELEIAHAHVMMKNPEAARRWFERAIASRPTYAESYVRAAMFERRQKWATVAAIHLQAAHALAPDNAEILNTLVETLDLCGYRIQAQDTLMRRGKMGRVPAQVDAGLLHRLTAVGRYADVIDLCERIGTVENARHGAGIRSNLAHARLAVAYDVDRLVTRAAARERSARWMDADFVLGTLRAAISVGRPFSLVRVGDGEARYLLRDDPSLPGGLAAEDRDAISDVIWYNWFGETLPAQLREAQPRLRQQVTTAMMSADILGVTNAERLAIDWTHFGYLAYLDGYAESFLQENPAGSLTDAMVHMALHEKDPFLAGLLRGQDWLGVISPHAALGPRLRRHLGIPDGQDHVIPGEMRLPDSPGVRRGQGHFPEEFERLAAALHVPRRGAVVLVAGGLLGKVYASVVRKRGGIAIDIGSLADAWMGFATRPGQFQPAEKWMLPA